MWLAMRLRPEGARACSTIVLSSGSRSASQQQCSLLGRLGRQQDRCAATAAGNVAASINTGSPSRTSAATTAMHASRADVEVLIAAPPAARPAAAAADAAATAKLAGVVVAGADFMAASLLPASHSQSAVRTAVQEDQQQQQWQQGQQQQQEQVQQQEQQQQQQQQQQQPQHAPTDAQQVPYKTQLLAIDPAALPPASPPGAATAQQILTAASLPNLSRESCPHLYYTLPEPSSSSDSSSSRQQHSKVTEGLPDVTGISAAASPTVACRKARKHQAEALLALQQAAALLRSNLPVAMPTETVYGLAGNAMSASAVASIFEAKGRPSDNPLIVHVSDLDMLASLYPKIKGSADGGSQNPIPQQYWRLVAAYWPGPLTLLLPTSPLIPAAVTAGQPTMAVRMPAHPVARALIAAAGVPLAAPSANTSGRPSPTTAEHVLEDLAGLVPAVVDGGGCGFGVESTVLDGLRMPPVVLRPGGVTAEQLLVSPDMVGLQVYSRDFIDKALEAAPTTPGMKYRHYSPTAPVLLLDPAPAWQQQQQQQEQQHNQQLEQLMEQATKELLQQLHVQQQQLVGPAAAAGGPAAPQRVVLLSTCSSEGVEQSVGWTPDSLARIGAGNKQQADTSSAEQQLASSRWQEQQQQQQQQQQIPASGQQQIGSSSRCISSAAGDSSRRLEVLQYVLGSWQQPDVVAQNLFAGLRAADHVGAGVIVVQGLLPVGTGLAVMNRLHKAASQRVPVGLASR